MINLINKFVDEIFNNYFFINIYNLIMMFLEILNI